MTITAVPTDRRTVRLAGLALIGVTAVWGSTFALSKDLLERLPVTDYLGLRFLTAAAVVLLVRPGLLRSLSPDTLRTGMWLGVIYSVGQLLQFFGLLHTAPTVSAFVVSMYVVFTPLLAGLLTRSAPHRVTVVATGVATLGVAVMSLRGWGFGAGEAITLVSAAIYAVHILATSRWARPGEAFPLTFVQLVTMGVCLTTVGSVDGLEAPAASDFPAFLYLAVLAAALALLVQTWAQARLTSGQTAVLMVLEPVWAAFFGIVAWRESLEVRTLVGGTLILSAMLLVIARPETEPVGDTAVPAHP